MLTGACNLMGYPIPVTQAHFGLWAITKSTLILGSKVSALSAAQLAVVSNKGLIAVNQDPLGVQARKVRGV